MVQNRFKMNKISLSFLLLLFILFQFSFKAESKKGLNTTYGICEVEESVIELDLNEDFSFSYRDVSNATKPILVRGNYKRLGNKIILNSEIKGIKFHRLWKLSDDLKVVRSRKALAFYTLHQLP